MMRDFFVIAFVKTLATTFAIILASILVTTFMTILATILAKWFCPPSSRVRIFHGYPPVFRLPSREIFLISRGPAFTGWRDKGVVGRRSTHKAIVSVNPHPPGLNTDQSEDLHDHFGGGLAVGARAGAGAGRRVRYIKPLYKNTPYKDIRYIRI